MELTKEIKDKVAFNLFLELRRLGVSQAEFARRVALRQGIKFDKSVLPKSSLKMTGITRLLKTRHG